MTLRTALRAAAALTLAALPFAAPAQDEGGDAAPDPAIETVVATVDGAEITLGEIILMRAELPEQYQNIPDPQLMPALIQQAVNQRLLAEMGRADGAGETPLARLRADAAERDHLAEMGLRRVIREATGTEVLREVYETRYAEAEPAEEVRASHILVPEQAAAEALLAELEDGADFAALAAEHGTDGTAQQGGDLGWFTEDRMVAPFAAAAFAAEEGELVGPVETQFGWHLILVTGRRDQPVPAFEAVEADLAREAAATAAEGAVEAARAAADIVVMETLPAPEAIRRDDLLLGDEG